MLASTPAVASLELTHELTAEARQWLARAQEFSDEVVRPLGRVLDRMDAQSAIAAGSPVRDFLAQAHREGYTRLTDAPHRGGIGLSAGAEYLVLEELATADAGLAVLLLAAPLPFRWAGTVSLGPLDREVSIPYFRGERIDWIGANAVTDGARFRATPAAGGWRVSGRADAVPGGAIATHAAIACTTEGEAPGRTALAIVPLDRHGASRGPVVDQLGLRTQARARLVLDGLRISSDELLAAPCAAQVDTAAALAHVVAAIAAVGIGRAAYEGALRLARERVHRGTLLAEYGNDRRHLFRLFALLEAARALTRSAHLRASAGPDRDEAPLSHAVAARAFALEAALEIVDAAMELCARRADARGVVRYLDGTTFQPEKLLRDVRSCTVVRPAGGSPAPLAAVYP